MVTRRNDVERWFIGRGVPHFIEGYEAVTDIWTRAVPLLLVAYFAGGLNALDLRHWSLERNLVAAAVVVTVLVVGWAITNLVRRRPWFTRPTTVGLPELATFVIGPVVPSLLFGQWGDALQVLIGGFAVLAVVYIGTSYGVVPLTVWAVRRLIDQIESLARMVSRALPLLLLFTTFLFINAEVWQVAGTLVGPVYIATIGIFFVLGAVFVMSRVPALMQGLSTFDDWAEVSAAVIDTPAEGYVLPTAGSPPAAPLSGRQRLNVGLVSVFSQAVQITFVAAILTVFFVIFGFLVMPEQTVAAWTQLSDVNVLARWNVGGRQLVLTEPLLRVAGFLGTFSGMYFTVVLSTDATYRDEFSEDVQPLVRQALAVRVAYRWKTSGG